MKHTSYIYSVSAIQAGSRISVLSHGSVVSGIQVVLSYE